jgi:hypothetical protein
MSDTRILSLEHAKREIVAGIDEAITVLKGSVDQR